MLTRHNVQEVNTQLQQENTVWQLTDLGFIIKDMLILEEK